MTQCTTIGLIAAPELAEGIAKDLVDRLPKKLANKISNGTKWKIETVVDPLTGSAETIDEIFQAATSYRGHKTWDYIICLTDLPVFHGKKVVTVDINESLNISLISIPAFGFRPVLNKVEKTVVYTFKEMHQRDDSLERKTEENVADKNAIKTTKLLRRSFPISPVRKIRLWMRETGDLHTRIFVTPKIYGKLRLLSGMTFANNPFQMMSSLTHVVAIAFTTGAFAMIFPTMWKLSHIFSNGRLTAIMLAAVIGMVIWISIAHKLWEPLSTSKEKHISRLYNLTTAMTLFIAILAYYVIVFLLFFSTSLILIPSQFLSESLDLDVSISIVSYLKIAWFAASLSIVSGAIGAGLANEELVRNSTYGYRQQSRYEKVKELREK